MFGGGGHDRDIARATAVGILADAQNRLLAGGAIEMLSAACSSRPFTLSK